MFLVILIVFWAPFSRTLEENEDFLDFYQIVYEFSDFAQLLIDKNGGKTLKSFGNADQKDFKKLLIENFGDILDLSEVENEYPSVNGISWL